MQRRIRETFQNPENEKKNCIVCGYNKRKSKNMVENLLTKFSNVNICRLFEYSPVYRRYLF